jgi:maleamate amidohydrolase
VVDACQLGYRAIVAREAVSDHSIPAHEQSLIDIETKYGDVRPVGEIIQSLRRSDR